ncbi:universal stress protein [Salinisphaera sp. C84B14]|uniref:universal stress protein n=1 Tax=Salinisphaera sp. C84B14 TaxID=1304155 RepID=UPI00334231D0
MFNAIVVAVDGSEHSKRAIDIAADMGQRYDAAVHVVHIPQHTGHEKTLALGGAAITLQPSRAELEAAGESVVAAARGLLEAAGCKKIETEILGGDPAQQIVAAAKRVDADLIIMGRRGLSDFTGLVIGSTSHKVAHLAPCACLTTR